MKIVHTKVSLDKIIRHWAKGYSLKDGEIFDYEYYIDPFKQVVIFKQYVEEKEKSDE